jgi:hypothetical protein
MSWVIAGGAGGVPAADQFVGTHRRVTTAVAAVVLAEVLAHRAAGLARHAR